MIRMSIYGLIEIRMSEKIINSDIFEQAILVEI